MLCKSTAAMIYKLQGLGLLYNVIITFQDIQLQTSWQLTASDKDYLQYNTPK